MKKRIALYIAVLCWSPLVTAQIEDISPPDRLPDKPSLQQDSSEVVVVHPWLQHTPLGSYTIANDSTLRWQIWPNWGDFYAYRNDVISFRQGTKGQIDAFHINGYTPDEQKVRMEGIRLNNPVTGLVNYNMVPHHKISKSSEQHFGSYYSQIKLKDYYITSPVSYLNYDESKFDYRNLEFMVSQNFSAKTNLELSFWDRRDGGYYPNDKVKGSQVFGRFYYHLNENYQLRTFYLRNQFGNEEPFGYQIGDPLTFPFDQFASQPVSSNGASDFTRWDLVTGIYHRRDTTAVEDVGLEAFISTNRNKVSYSGDTLNTNVKSYGSRINANRSLAGFTLEATLEGMIHKADAGSPLSDKSWGEWNLLTGATFKLNQKVRLYGSATFQSKTQKSGYEAGGGVRIGTPSDRLFLDVGAFTYSRIPEIQAMYWNSAEYTGNARLNEKGESLTAQFEVNPWATVSLGVKGRLKSAVNYTVLSSEGAFSDGGSYEAISTTAYATFENHRFEAISSATYQQYDYQNNANVDPALNNLDQVLWVRNAAFIKGYVFERAAYMKIGLKSLLSPMPYSSRTYNTALGYWQANSNYQEIPSFFRLDGELSARVRRIMIVMRWENLLDGFGQAGYFETAGYPMPPRRLVIGIRARFIN
ncbi:MAG: hypothetical protein FH748_10255 [Balneolaceae bacterium]|nr:hypothetical protein [Balneolaceae bacterium]